MKSTHVRVARDNRFMRGIAAMVLPAVLSAVSSQALAQGPPQIAPPRAPQPPGQLTLKNNAAWDSVHVEVRTGASNDCSQNALIAVLWIKRDRVWLIKSNSPVCWRREANPGSGNDTWTGWTRRALAPDERRSDPLGSVGN